MEIIETVHDLRACIKEEKKLGKTIGLVPTMGYLHEGHVSLIKKARQMCDVVVVSIFVNPTQFGPGEDLDRYPRDLEKDTATCKSAGCDIIFHPSAEEMYQNPLTYITVENLSETLCGRSRPTHFRGVTTVVAKLFHIAMPDYAFFGQKDAQQLLIVKKMVQDLNFDVKIIACPIVREPDGLAKSSRNTYLTPEQRKDATLLYKSLLHAQKMIEDGERNAKAITDAMRGIITSSTLSEIDYVEIVSAQTLQPLDTLGGEILIALAVKFGNTRLIDNLMLQL
jgi:pantoate--beta-alanine ligase